MPASDLPGLPGLPSLLGPPGLPAWPLLIWLRETFGPDLDQSILEKVQAIAKNDYPKFVLRAPGLPGLACLACLAFLA